MATKRFRIEKDSLGEVKVPKRALWGAQTQRAVDNFPISGIKMDFPFTKSFVSSLGIIKDAAAKANLRLKLLPAKKAKATIAVYIGICDAKPPNPSMSLWCACS